MKIGDLVISIEILVDVGVMGSMMNLEPRKVFEGHGVIVDITKTSALVLTKDGETVMVKKRHLEVINGRED